MQAVRWDTVPANVDVNLRGVRRRASGRVAPVVVRGKGQDAVGAGASHRIASRSRPDSRVQTARRHGMVLLGTVVLLAAFAGMLIGRMLSSV